jgi:hypothetical protein
MGAKRLPATVKNLTPMRAAWLAALIDGEGTISIHLTPNGSKRAWIAVYNTNTDILDKCAYVCGAGVVRKKMPGKKNDGFKRLQMWEWELDRARDAHHLLCQLYPYLIIKQHKAIDLIVHWRDERTNDISENDHDDVKEMKMAQRHLSNREFSVALGFGYGCVSGIYSRNDPLSSRVRIALDKYKTEMPNRKELSWR